MVDLGQSGATDLRCCHFCRGPIPDDERAVEAKTRNGWVHFECWYDGFPFKRDPQTGRCLDGWKA